MRALAASGRRGAALEVYEQTLVAEGLIKRFGGQGGTVALDGIDRQASATIEQVMLLPCRPALTGRPEDADGRWPRADIPLTGAAGTPFRRAVR